MKEYDHYDINFKINCVEDFLKLKEANPDTIGYGSYAISKGLNKSTFIAWVKKYKASKLKDFGFLVNKETSDTSPVILNNDTINSHPQFIKISKDTIIDDDNKENKIKLNYKDASLEFNTSDLEKVMEILRRW